MSFAIAFLLADVDYTAWDLRKYNIMELGHSQVGNHYPYKPRKQPEAITFSTERHEQPTKAK